MESPTGSTSTGPAPATGDVPAAQVDIDGILAEVEALTAKAAAAAVTPAADAPAPAMSKEESDLASLEREIEALLSGKPAEPTVSAPSLSPTPAPATPPTRAIALDALEERSVDPLVAEIDETLADDADALLRRSDGDIDRALATVFDARALGGQEEEVNRALIDAFGSSRVQRPSFQPPVVTNPAPKFEGVSREMPATSNPNASTASQAKPRINVEYSGEKPFEPAFPKIDAISAAEAPPPMNAAAGADLAASAAMQAASAPAGIAAPAAAAAAPVIPDVPAEAVPQGPGFLARLLAHAAALVRFTATLPLRACAFPMRFVPEGARTVVGIAAVTLVLWTPAAWWFAATRAKAPGVGPVAVVPREAPAKAEGEAAAEAPAADAKPAAGH